jgi:hypothetical protein
MFKFNGVTLRLQVLTDLTNRSESIDMCQHTFQISDIGIAPTHVPKVARMGFLVLISTAVRRDNRAVTG